MRLLEGCSILYTGSAFRVSVIGAKLVCLSITSKQARVAPEYCHAVLGMEIEVSSYISHFALLFSTARSFFLSLIFSQNHS